MLLFLFSIGYFPSFYTSSRFSIPDPDRVRLKQRSFPLRRGWGLIFGTVETVGTGVFFETGVVCEL